MTNANAWFPFSQKSIPRGSNEVKRDRAKLGDTDGSEYYVRTDEPLYKKSNCIWMVKVIAGIIPIYSLCHEIEWE